MADNLVQNKEDEELALEVAADKNREAAAELVNRYAPKLKGYLTKNFGAVFKSDGIQDAVQTAFVRMLKYIESYDRSVAPFEAWMIRLAYNVAQDMLSDKNKHSHLELGDDMVWQAEIQNECKTDENNAVWQVELLNDLIENKLKGFEQALARCYVATGGNIDSKRIIAEWGKTRNCFDATKSKVKRKFQEALNAEEHRRRIQKGRL